MTVDAMRAHLRAVGRGDLPVATIAALATPERHTAWPRETLNLFEWAMMLQGRVEEGEMTETARCAELAICHDQPMRSPWALFAHRRKAPTPTDAPPCRIWSLGDRESR